MIGSITSRLRRLGTAAAAPIVFGVVACENPQPPVACGAIPQVTVNAGETSTATACFTDPNGDMLSYSAMSTNPSVAAASASGATVTVSAAAPGSASVTVTATDAGGLQGQQSFQVIVPNRAPLPRGTIPPMTVRAGERETVDASSYFTEPDGETLAFGAASSNPAAATVSVAGSTVTVAAVARGMSTVTVTATDPGGLQATQTFETTVADANREPEPVGTIPAKTLAPGGAAMIDAAQYFTDPDGDILAYTAISSDTAVAGVSVSGAAVAITAVATGSAAVTITARDPGGLTATQRVSVTVKGDGAGLRDDFNSSASLDDWEFEDATAVANNGVLELTASSYVGWARRDVAPNLAQWMIETKMGRMQTSSALVNVRWLTGHPRYQAVDFVIGDIVEDSNWSLWIGDAGTGQWAIPDSLFGYSSAINDGAGELTTIRLSFIDGLLKAVAGNTELFSMKYETNQVGYEVFRHVFEVGLVSESETGGTTVLFDWIDVDGVPVVNPFVAGESTDLSGIATRLRLPLEKHLLLRR